MDLLYLEIISSLLNMNFNKVRSMKKTFLILMFLFLSLPLLAQEGSKYYEERLRPYKNIPIAGNGSYYLIDLRSSMLDSPNVSFWQNEARIGGYIDLDYLGIYAELYTRFADNIHAQADTFMSAYLDTLTVEKYNRNNGYDEKNYQPWAFSLFAQEDGSITLFPNKIYPENYYVLVRNISPFIPEIRVGKLWFDFNAYTLYRTWGIEGIQLKQDLPFYFVVPFAQQISFEAGYNFFYSYNKVHDSVVPNDYAMYDRTILGGQYYLKSSDSGTYLEFIHLLYNVSAETNFDSFGDRFISMNFSKSNEKLRKNNTYGFHVKQKLPWKFQLDGIVVLQNHFEYGLNISFTNQYAQRYEMKNYNSILDFGFGYRQTSIDFMPRNPATWENLPPFNSEAYGWNYEEQRLVSGNDKAWFVWMEKFILGVRLNLYYEFSSYLDKENVYPWRKTSLPGSKFRTTLYYQIFSMEIYNRFYNYRGVIPNSDGTESYKIMGLMENEIYLPLTGSMSIDVRSDTYRKLKTGNVINYVNILFIQYSYKVNSILRVVAEAKATFPQSAEPAWLLKANDYIDQTAWGADDFAKISLEINF